MLEASKTQSHGLKNGEQLEKAYLPGLMTIRAGEILGESSMEQKLQYIYQVLEDRYTARYNETIIVLLQLTVMYSLEERYYRGTYTVNWLDNFAMLKKEM
jgi:hypothetical protein